MTPARFLPHSQIHKQRSPHFRSVPRDSRRILRFISSVLRIPAASRANLRISPHFRIVPRDSRRILCIPAQISEFLRISAASRAIPAAFSDS
ncbi:MAG: hypothetical protein MJY99_12115 [Fibrobacter sp.]|nr:hypothetical protein [Fibrobacter sp.]